MTTLFLIQIALLAKGLISFGTRLPPELPLLKNEVVRYTCPAHTARTRNIFMTFIQVWELDVSYVTMKKIKNTIVSNLAIIMLLADLYLITYIQNGPARSQPVTRCSLRSHQVCTEDFQSHCLPHQLSQQSPYLPNASSAGQSKSWLSLTYDPTSTSKSQHCPCDLPWMRFHLNSHSQS